TGSVFSERGHWLAGVPTDAYLRIDFDLAEEWHLERLRHALAFAVAKNVDPPVAVLAVEIAHVLNHAEDFHLQLAEHLNGFAYVSQRHHRRCCHDHRTVHHHALDESPTAHRRCPAAGQRSSNRARPTSHRAGIAGSR